MILDHDFEHELGHRVTLDVFYGPLDLLLYLIKKEEIDIYDIPIARIFEQYMAYLEAMRILDINVAGEFLVMASTLMEIKSRMLLPVPPGEDEGLEDHRAELVARLLEYKRFKEAGKKLAVLLDFQSMRYPRPATLFEYPPSDEGMWKEVELWDLVSAFNRLTRETSVKAPYPVNLEDVPIEQLMEWILERLRAVDFVKFTELFDQKPDRGKIVGTFLALLELIRLGKVRARQEAPFEEILIEPAVHIESLP